MNIYLSKNQQKVLNALLETAEDIIIKSDSSVKENLDSFLETVNEIKAKLDKKKVSKNGYITDPIELSCKNSTDMLIVKPREDGRAIILESKNKVPTRNGFYIFKLGRENAIKLSNYIIEYLNAWGIDYTPEDKAYSEEINVYADEVERSISISADNISFICYTDESDDYWTFLTPYKAKYFVELLLGYINNSK